MRLAIRVMEKVIGNNKFGRERKKERERERERDMGIDGRQKPERSIDLGSSLGRSREHTGTEGG